VATGDVAEVTGHRL